MSFHITITNNETGNVLDDFDTKALIGAYDKDEDITCGFHRIHCSPVELAAVITQAIDAAHNSSELLPKPLRRAVHKALRKEFFKRVFARFSRKRED